MRQSNTEFVAFLNQLRVGIVDQEVDRLLKSRFAQMDDFSIFHYIHHSLDEVLIVSLRKERNEWNRKFLNCIDSRNCKLKAVNIEKLKKDFVPSILEFEIDTKVILLKTLDFVNDWVNGTPA